MKVSLRIAGRVTSVNIRNSVVALYCIVHGNGKLTPGKAENLVQDAVYRIAGNWNGNGRGLGGFVTDALLESVLENEELAEYHQLVQVLES